MPLVGIEPTLTKHGTHQHGQEMGDFPQSPPISFLSPLTLKLIKGVRAVERVGQIDIGFTYMPKFTYWESLTPEPPNLIGAVEPHIPHTIRTL